MWGQDSPDDWNKPHTCTIGRKILFSDNGGCTIADIGGLDKKRVGERLKACGSLGLDEDIGDAVEAVLFDDTFGEIERVVEGGLRRLNHTS